MNIENVVRSTAPISSHALVSGEAKNDFMVQTKICTNTFNESSPRYTNEYNWLSQQT